MKKPALELLDPLGRFAMQPEVVPYQPRCLFVVLDTAFNRHWYFDLIGKQFSLPPGYAQVQPIDPDQVPVDAVVILTDTEEDDADPDEPTVIASPADMSHDNHPDPDHSGIYWT